MNSRLRRSAATLAAGVLVAGLVDATLPATSSAFPDKLQVVGTSDVQDSGLMDAVIIPGFKAATGIDMQYIPKGTGAALDYAKTGSASAAIVHAASLENQFVAGGYSAESSGRAIFWGDYILGGSTADPAGIKPSSGYQHDIVTAFEKIAAAGAAHHADFVSRGGTPGTTVQEHLLWAATTGVPVCPVSDANGGGAVPVVVGTQPAPAGDGTCKAQDATGWYHTTGKAQGDNVVTASACTGAVHGGTIPDDCYVFTDRGTFNFTQDKGTNQLQIVTRDNDPAARGGGRNALINVFHAYGVEPSKFPPGTIDSDRAKKFLDWLTSPDAQAAMGRYLTAHDTAAFVPAASPSVSVTGLPASAAGGQRVSVDATLGQPIPGYPAFANAPVTLRATSQGSATPAAVATGVTDASGHVTLSFTPSSTATYQLKVEQIEQTELPALRPVFRDLFQPVTTNLGLMSVSADLPATAAKLLKHRKVRVSGALSPAASPGAELVLYRAKAGKPLRPSVVKPLANGATTYRFTYKFPKGRWKYVLVYQNPGVVQPVATKVRKVTIH